MRSLYINGNPLRLDPTKSLGKGLEADVYDIGNGLCAKVFKTPDHPDYAGDKPEDKLNREAAAQRLTVHQKKLPNFPLPFSSRVVQPTSLITDKAGKYVHGYAMPLLDKTDPLWMYSQKSFRDKGVDPSIVRPLMRDLHNTVVSVHQASAIIGDFNDLNVLVDANKQVFVIDADSFQIPGFPTRVFTYQFVDPLLCDPIASKLMLYKPYNENADWYAFTVMLFRSLLLTDPYGGVLKPSVAVTHDARPLHRITVMDSRVTYPKKAVSYYTLPDDVLDYFIQTFEKDRRGEFPINMLDQIHWVSCPSCHELHSRSVCPFCKHVLSVPKPLPSAAVTFKLVFETAGTVLYAAVQGQTLRYLYHLDGEFKREFGTVVPASLDPSTRYRINGEQTLFGQGNALLTFAPSVLPGRTSVDAYGSLPMFDANGDKTVFLQNGSLWRSDALLGRELIGDVLQNQTLFWVGSHFGFGFYRAGSLTVGFVFNPTRRGLNDSVKLPSFAGQLIDSTCVFSKDLAWFFTTVVEAGRHVNRCYVIDSTGVILAEASAIEGDGSWLGTIRGKAAYGSVLFSPTDAGVCHVSRTSSALKSQLFADTEPYVDSQSVLLLASDGLYVVGSHTIHLLKRGVS